MGSTLTSQGGLIKWLQERRSWVVEKLLPIYDRLLSVNTITSKVALFALLFINGNLRLAGLIYKGLCKTTKIMAFVVLSLVFYSTVPLRWYFHKKIQIVARSYLIDKFSRERVDNRVLFKSVRVSEKTKHGKANHSHLKAATERCQGNMHATIFAQMMGRNLYSVSMSNSERGTNDGDHYHYCAKDLQSKSRRDVLKDQLVILTDVDYYCDMEKYLTGNDILVHTFVPDKVAGSAMDSTYTVVDDDYIDMKVQGGANYKHQLWDYDNDHIMVDHWWGSCLYLVEQKEVGHQKRLIFLNCVKIIYGPFAWFLEGYRLIKRKLTYGNVTYMKRLDGEDDKTKVVHNFGYKNYHTSVDVTDKALMTVFGRMKLSNKPNISDVERILRSYDERDAQTSAVILFEILQDSKFCQNTNMLTNPITMLPESYQTTAPLVHEVGTERHRIVTPPLMLGAAAPVKSLNNDTACLQGRVIDVKNKVESYPPFFWLCMDEFLKLLIPDDQMRCLSPSDFEAQYEHFHRPTQRSLIEQCKHLMFNDESVGVKSFQKSEFYGKVTAPRNISTLPMGHNFRLGQYCLTLSEKVLKLQDWYCFGKHPSVIEQRICDLTIGFDTLEAIDINKCDGSTGYIAHCLSVAVFMRAFHQEYHAEIQRLLAKEAHIAGVTSNGLYYECDFNTLSGSSITSLRNSTLNAFINYVCLRFKYDRAAAYMLLGAYGGDDGGSRGCTAQELIKTFAKFGMSIKTQTVQKHEAFPFLGRIYLDPWTTQESVCDVKRQIVKLHGVCAPKHVPVEVAIHRKVNGFEITDRNTPVIKEWIDMIRRVIPKPDEKEFAKYNDAAGRRDASYWSKFETPFCELVSHELAEKVIAETLDISVTELSDFRLELSMVASVSEMTNLHKFFKTAMKVEVTAAINGELLEGKKEDHQQKVTNAADMPVPTIDRVLHKTRNVKSNSRSVFNNAPNSNDSLAQRRKHEPLKQCNFIMEGRTCPWGTKCKFPHPATKRTAWVKQQQTTQ